MDSPPPRSGPLGALLYIHTRWVARDFIAIR